MSSTHTLHLLKKVDIKIIHRTQGTTYDSTSATGVSYNEPAEMSVTARLSKTGSHRLRIEEKKIYGEIPVHFFLVGLWPDILENDAVEYDGNIYKITEVYTGENVNYTKLTCITQRVDT